MTEGDSIRFNALRNALYHTARQRRLARLDRLFTFIVLILGTVAVATVLPELGLNASLIGVAVAAVSAMQLVFAPGNTAAVHRTLQREYYQILAEIEETLEPSANDIARWRSRLSRISADEPPTFRGIDARAYNDALDAMELSRDQRLVIPFKVRLLGAILAFEGHQFRKQIEVDPATN